MGKQELDLTFKKASEFKAGADATLITDSFILLDASDGGGDPVVRPIQDIVNLASQDADVSKTVQVTVTLAELNAGKTLIAAVSGSQILVTDFNVVCDGAFGALTSTELEDTSGTVNVCSLAQAQMTDNAVLTKAITGVTLGVGVAEGLTVSEALVITKTGSAATTATKLTATVTYILV